MSSGRPTPYSPHLEHVKPPLPRLVLADERLRLAQSLTQLGLRERGAHSQLAQEPEQDGRLGCVDRLLHLDKLVSRRGPT